MTLSDSSRIAVVESRLTMIDSRSARMENTLDEVLEAVNQMKGRDDVKKSADAWRSGLLAAVISGTILLAERWVWPIAPH